MALDLEVAGVVTEITETDKLPTYDKTVVKRLRDSHHALARAIASGMPLQAASAATGYSPSRISILQADPTFRELLDHYRRTKAEAIIDVEARFLYAGLDSLQSYMEQLEDDPESIPVALRVEAAKVFSAIAGYAAVSRSINKNFNYGIGDDMDRLKAQRAAKKEKAA